MIVHGFVGSSHVKKEKEKARQLRRSPWWKQKLSQGLCYYCEQVFPQGELSMDHKVPLSRGGRSNKGNVVVCCKSCNSEKKYYTPVERLLMDNSAE